MSSLPLWEVAGESDLPGHCLAWGGASERERSLEQALHQIRGDVDSLGWSTLLRSLSASSPTATQGLLKDRHGRDVAFGVGAGKGDRPAAWVGAYYEAMEHAVTGPAWRDALDFDLSEVAQILRDDLPEDPALLRLPPSSALACLSYDALDGGSTFKSPLFLWAPWYVDPDADGAQWRRAHGDSTDYTPVLSYSTNTGCAIGATRDEALLHALNEWVERDALSLFLLTSVHDGGRMPALISPASLPDGVRAILDAGEECFGRPIHLLDLTTDIGVPVVFAYVASAEGLEPVYGMGASFFASVAAERAITEVVQGELLRWAVSARGTEATSHGAVGGRLLPDRRYEDLVSDHDIYAAVRHRFAPHPALLRCAELQISPRLVQSQTVPLREDDDSLPVAEQVEQVVGRISAAGHRVGTTDLHVFESGTTVVHTQCVGLERFHLVLNGHLALPGPRGRRHRRQTLPEQVERRL